MERVRNADASKKPRELVFWVMDSRPWNRLVARDGDIVVNTWSKTGTTWMQQIVTQLILGPDPTLYGPDVSPWIDSRFPGDPVAVAEARAHRRVLKSHIPLDATPFHPGTKYIHVGRDIRDTYFSWHHHHQSFTPEILAFINHLPGRTRPPVGYPDPDIRFAFRHWLETDGYPNPPYFAHMQGWFDARTQSNLLLVHFADLKRDFRACVERVARFLDIEIDESKWPALTEYCSLDHMRRLAAANETLGHVFVGGGATFINQGTNGRWRDVLTEEDIAFCDATAARNLSADCARWLATGRLPDDTANP